MLLCCAPPWSTTLRSGMGGWSCHVWLLLCLEVLALSRVFHVVAAIVQNSLVQFRFDGEDSSGSYAGASVTVDFALLFWLPTSWGLLHSTPTKIARLHYSLAMTRVLHRRGYLSCGRRCQRRCTSPPLSNFMLESCEAKEHVYLEGQITLESC